jgi:hypothetical protein
MCDTAPSHVVVGSQRFEGTSCLHFQVSVGFRTKVAERLLNDTALYPRRGTSQSYMYFGLKFLLSAGVTARLS